MGIADLMTRPPSAGIFPQATQALDSRGVADMKNIQANTRGTELDNAMKQIDLEAKRQDVPVEDILRQIRKGQAQYDLGKQPERQQRNDVDEDLLFDEQIRRGINDPVWYNRLAKRGMLPNEFRDADGNPLPYEATAQQRIDLNKRAVDSTPHVQAKELADIRASALVPSYPDTPVDAFSRDAAFDYARQLIADEKLQIGKLNSKEPNDAKQFYRAVGELPEQIATHAASKAGGGRKLNKTEIRQQLGKFLKESIEDNTKNRDAPWYAKWQYNDQAVNWNKFNDLVNKEYRMNPNYSSPVSQQMSVSMPAFMLDPEGNKYAIDALKRLAAKEGKTLEQIIEEEGLTAGK